MHRPTKSRRTDHRWPPLASGVLVVVGLAFLAITGCSDPPVETRSTAGTPASRLLEATESAGLPPLPPYRAETYDYYRLGFLEDGYPGRWTDEGLVPHPIYGAYVVIDYLNLFEQTGDRTFLDAARRVADAALARMDDQAGMLRFFYEPEWGLGSSGERYVSGLTQAHYLDQLSRLHELSGDPRYAEACERVLRCLATPVEEGGVLAMTPLGPVIEEAPHSPRDLVLNGWLTAIRGLRRYLERTESDEAASLLESNLATLATILPLYDAPNTVNSRYRIRGYGHLRLVLDDAAGVRLDRPTLEIPGDDVYPVANEIDNRWQMGFVRGVESAGDRFTATEDRILLNLVMSLLSMPEPNLLRFTIETPKPQDLAIELASGPFDPLQSGLRTTGWTMIEEIGLQAGVNEIEIELGFEEIDPFVYPTNFLKKIAGRHHNAYHFVHIDGLESLCDEYGIEAFCDFAGRWRGYVEQWPDHPAYRDAGIEFDRYTPPRD